MAFILFIWTNRQTDDLYTRKQKRHPYQPGCNKCIKCYLKGVILHHNGQNKTKERLSSTRGNVV